ncbi:MAG TPA: DUF488 domain-containing protein, partial [Kofleriaceae bacterium]
RRPMGRTTRIDDAGALFTIGYEGRALDELIAILAANRIDRVIDIRELPLSRRRGFSKTPLGTALGGAGIDYVHMRQAGNPYRRLKDSISRDELLAKYKTHITGAREAVAQVAAQARGHRVALLCFEAEAQECHRSLLAPRVAKLLGVAVRDL